ncbi:MAG: hypothetical protein FJ291_01575 [Planctomycetes bacterium]|nr:hypothetical protein [Planctomycetota bacterium]
MTIRGSFFAGAPYVNVKVRTDGVAGVDPMLVDTGAFCTLVLDRDAKALGLSPHSLSSASPSVIGVGGSVKCLLLPGVELVMKSDQEDEVIPHNLSVACHDLAHASPAEQHRIMQLPSLLGRDILKRYSVTCDFVKETLLLARD